MSIRVTFRGKRMGDLIFSHLSFLPRVYTLTVRPPQGGNGGKGLGLLCLRPW